MENPFINYWLWYYDVLWRYWPIVVVLTIIAVWLIARRFYKREEASNLINVYKEGKDGWHDSMDVPCPGSLIVCENGKHQLFFGYSVSDGHGPALWLLPNVFLDYKKPPMAILRGSSDLIPVGLFQRWQYIERRILPVETLGTYEKQYKQDEFIQEETQWVRECQSAIFR